MSFFDKVLILLAISVSSGFKYDKNLLSQIEKTDGHINIEDILHTIVSDAVEDNIEETPNGCACVNYNCGCCALIAWKHLNLNETFCANVSYLPEQYGMSVTVTFGNHTLINQTVSARNPPPICAEIPYLKELASICIGFHDLDVTSSTFTGCVDLSLLVAKVFKEKYELGCFTIPLHHNTTSPQKKTPDYKAHKMDQEPDVRILHSVTDLQGTKHRENGKK